MTWWRDAVGYEVYVRSFSDSDGDGIGDLPGVRQHLDHVAELGVDILWLTPFYPSPQADHGYDVADYTEVEPAYGALADIDAIIEEAHERALRVMIDIVPNHTSDHHRWFQASRSSRDDPRRDWYIWREPAPDGGPPNNWVSHFGGPAWTLDETTGQYYLHLFLPEQPDLNWKTPAVADAFDDILRFWLERGVDGFRIDVAHALRKREGLPDIPLREDAPSREEPRFADFQHLHDLDQPEVLEIYRRWRRVVEPHDAVLLGEVYLLDPVEVARYVQEQDGLHLALYIPAVKTSWDAETIRRTLSAGVREGRGHFAWPVASHDDPHPATRFGGGARGRQRHMAYLTLVLGMPGVPFLFQGDELGLEDGDVPPAAAQDPAGAIPGGPGSRDGVRTPMPWTPDEPNRGFTDGEPWLPLGGRRPSDTVMAQTGDPTSYLHRTRDLLALRSERLADRGEVRWLDEDGPIVSYRRGDAVVAANCGDDPSPVAVPAGDWQVIYRSDVGRVTDAQSEGDTLVAPDTAVVLVR